MWGIVAYVLRFIIRVLAEFDELINQLENRFTYAKNNTVLPELPKMEWIEDFMVLVNKEIVYLIKEV